MLQIDKSTLQFLKDLKLHNDKEWFDQNRSRYESAKLNYEAFVQGVIGNITSFDPIFRGLEAKNCIYRINRDIRFSPDKSIYKTHMGAFIVKGGRKNGDKFTGYYLHIEPGNSLIAGGAHIPPPGWLKAIREKISEHGDDLSMIINNREFAGYFGEIEGEKLKTAPKGFPKDHPWIELLKFKSFIVARSFTDKEIISGECLDEVVKGFRIMKPFNDFLNVN